MQGEKVRHVPMARLRLFIFPGPLHQPPVGADAGGQQGIAGGPNPASQIVFNPQNFRGIQQIIEQVANELLVVRRTHREVSCTSVRGVKRVLG